MDGCEAVGLDGGEAPSRIVVNGVVLGLELDGRCPRCSRSRVPIFVSGDGAVCARCYVGCA